MLSLIEKYKLNKLKTQFYSCDLILKNKHKDFAKILPLVDPNFSYISNQISETPLLVAIGI